MPGHYVPVWEAPAKNVERAAHCGFYPPAAHLTDAVKVLKAAHPPGVSHRERALLPQGRDKVILDAQLHALHIHPVDEEFICALGETPERLRIHL